MVILAALAAVGVYQGGKAVSEDVGKRARRHRTEKDRKQQRRDDVLERQQRRDEEREKTQAMTVDERLEQLKKNIPNDKRKGVFRKK